MPSPFPRAYSLVDDWHLVPGFVDRRPAILVCDPNDLLGRPGYFVLLNWEKNSVVDILDFRFARYATEGAELMAWADQRQAGRTTSTGSRGERRQS